MDRVWLGVADAEGIGDALVGGGGLAVDAVGVDREQNGDAVPGAAGDLGGGYPEFTQSDTSACRGSHRSCMSLPSLGSPG
jgi:hypothetical protein